MAEKLEIIVSARDRASSTLGKIGGALGGVFKIAAGVLAADVFRKLSSQLVGFATSSINAASDLRETFTKVGVVFDKAAGAINDFSASSNGAIGLSEVAILDAASTFGVFGKSAGLAGADLADFSLDLTNLASDLASFYNTSPEDAIVALGAALRGESEPIRRYGVLLDDASLRQKALELGIIKTVKNALTPQQRVLAAQALIMAQTADAQGDFARTSDGLANSQRILAAQWKNVKTAVGSALLPVIQKLANITSQNLLPTFAGLIDNVFSKAGPAIASFAGRLGEVAKRVFALISHLREGGKVTANGALIYLFGPDAGGKLREVAASFQPVIEAVMNLLSAARDSLPMVQSYFADMWTFLKDAAATIGPQLISSIAGTLNTITEFWRAHGEEVMSVINFLFRTAVAVIGGAIVLIAGVIQGFVTLLSGLWTAVTVLLQGDWQLAWQMVLSTLRLAGGQIWQALQTILTLALSIVGTNLEQFVAAWQNNFNMAVIIVSTIFETIVELIRSKIEMFYEAGKDLIQGFIRGLKEKWQEVASWITEAIGALPDWVKRILGIESPSTVFMEIGEQMMAGLAAGINGSKLPKVAVNATTTRLINQAGNSTGAKQGLNMYNPVFHIVTPDPVDFLTQLQGLAG